MPLRNRIEAKAFFTCREARLLLGSRPSGDDNMESLTNMKVFLRNRETGQFYAGTKGWTGDASVAHNFKTVESAVQLARTQKLTVVEVVVRNNDSTDDSVLQVRPEP